MAEVLRCDVAVIGAGTAGLAAERAARKNGATTLLIDPDFIGTLCATTGCMPSKLLIAAADEAHRISKAGLFGISVDGVQIDGPAVMRRVRAERDRFARLTRDSIARIPDYIKLRARARFVAPNRLALDSGVEVEAKAVVVATGSAPSLPEAFASLGDSVVTSDSVFELQNLPARLAVVGTGAIGLELAQAFARLGADVTLFDRGEVLAKVRCPKVHASLRAIVEAEMTVHLGVDVVPQKIEGGARISWTGAENGEQDFDLVLAALGRPPMLSGLDLEKAGLLLDDRGVPCHDRSTMRCGDSSVFLAGDVAMDLPLLHEASHDGAIAGRNAAALPVPIQSDRYTALSITFTDPPVASIGDGEDSGAITGTADFSDQGRARVEGRNHGTLTLYAAAPDGRVVGADLVAPDGEHLAHLLAWTIQRGLTASELLELPFYHPTIEEGLKKALRTVCGATPIPLPQDQDSGTPPGG